MIYQKGEFWAIRGFPIKYTTLEAAEAVYNKIITKEAKVKLQEVLRVKKIIDNLNDPTPYEIIIEKNVCTLCNLEPCECLTYINQMDLGK